MNLWTKFAAKHPAAAKWVREGGLFVIGQPPRSVACPQSCGELAEEDGCGGGDVEALHETAHRDADESVCRRLDLVAYPGVFRAEYEYEGALRYVECFR